MVCLFVTLLTNALLDAYLAMRVYSAYNLYSEQHVIGSLRLTYMAIVAAVLAFVGLVTLVPYFVRSLRLYAQDWCFVPMLIAVGWLLVGGVLSLALGL
ncbi:hypothetical protein GCM10009835_17860 [Planosporangium flavigriseum]|uniref:Uncharacterized protein n=1 Tax=Planosporangium flavigriseum TaxID=373681 RepID=A0A8J3PNS2_9ACTN|nr:hypothetical protein Pfl04_35870 [Planosporangium flavigriseum]